jgi:Protein of unknown function (DUF742)
MTTGPGPESERTPDDHAPTEHRSPRVRPYTITGGRTRTQAALAMETLVETAPDLDDRWRGMSQEQQTISRLCLDPVSVAEVSARIALPLGVTRVVLDDMARGGLVVLHTTATDRPSRELMERVLDGLQRL